MSVMLPASSCDSQKHLHSLPSVLWGQNFLDWETLVHAHIQGKLENVIFKYITTPNSVLV